MKEGQRFLELHPTSPNRVFAFHYTAFAERMLGHPAEAERLLETLDPLPPYAYFRSDKGEANFILEIDVQSFFDTVDRTRLVEMLQKRVADGSILRLVGKCLHVGVLDGVELTTPDEGTVQGSTLSPLLGNVYLHYAMDLWFTEDVLPRLRGKAILVRYADDAVFGFERQDDAERVRAVLAQRLARFGLTLHPDKTRLLSFRRPLRSHGEGKGPATFDFLGFT